jgi:site-specific DNA recombinase
MKKPAAEEMKYCALYIRVSTADQAEKFSLPSQLKALRDKAAREGYTVNEDWIFPDEYSGKLESRPHFDELKALVETGAPDAVLVFDVSRFARNTHDALKWAAEFKKHDVKLDFVETPYADTPAGKLGFTTMAAVAEYLGTKLIEDSKRGQREKLEQGKLTHGTAPYGFVYIDKQQENGSRLAIDPDDCSVPGLSKVQVVREVFAWRRANTPTYRIVKMLNERGILTSGRWAKRGQDGAPSARPPRPSTRNKGVWMPPGPWSRQTVLQLLRNPTYKGEHTRSGIVVPCPAIVSAEIFDEVQRITEKCRQQHTGKPTRQYTFSGFGWCPCGGRLVRGGTCGTTGKRDKVYLRCSKTALKLSDRRCLARSVDVRLYEEIAWNAIWSMLKNPALLLELGRAQIEAMQKPKGTSTTTLERERERLAAKIATTRDMMPDNLLPYAKGKADIRAAEERIRQIEQELAANGRVLSLPPLRAIEAAVREITSGPEPKTFERRRSILEGILDLRIVYRDGDMEITGKVPVPDAATSMGSEKRKCNSGVGADAEGERKHRHRAEYRRFPEAAAGVEHVLHQCRHDGYTGADGKGYEIEFSRECTRINANLRLQFVFIRVHSWP